MKKKVILTVIATIILGSLFNFGLDKYRFNQIVPHLEGQIYFLKRDKQILNLYTASANLKQIELLYSNQGKGNTNENIVGYAYDPDQDRIIFEAMQDNQFALFSLKPGESEAQLVSNIAELDRQILRRLDAPVDRDPVVEFRDMKIFSREGSLYLNQNEEEMVLKKFRGIYDWKFNRGYEPITISPDGRYLLYHSSGHLTSIGVIATGFVKQILGLNDERYVHVLDLETKKSSKYMRGMRKIEWYE